MNVLTELEDRLLEYMQNNEGEIERCDVIEVLGIKYHAGINLVRKLTQSDQIISYRIGNLRTLLLPWRADELGIEGTQNASGGTVLPEDTPVIERQNMINRLWKVNYVSV